MMSLFLRPFFVPASIVLALLGAPSVQANCTLPSGNVERMPDGNFTDHGNGTVTHTPTSLMWKKCVQGRSGTDCTTGSSTTFTWQNALKAAVADTTGTYTDWRLPSRNELLSIVETGCSSPAINTTLFPLTPGSGTFWTSTPTQVDSPDDAWGVVFNNGSLARRSKSASYYVRLVRAGQAHDSFNEAGAEPSAFTFTQQTNVTVGATATSNTVTVTWPSVTASYPIAVVNGQYKIGAGAYTSASGNVAKGSSVTLQMTAPSTPQTTATTVLTVNGVSSEFKVTTGDVASEPLPFSIPMKTNVTRNARIVMDAVQVQGLTTTRSATLTGNGTPWLSVGAGATTPADGTAKNITNNQYLTTSLIAPTATNSSVSAIVTINGYDVPFAVSTAVEPTPFSFTTNTNVPANTLTTSNTVALSGLTLQGGTNNPYSISGGNTPQYSLNGSVTWLNTAGSALSNTNTFAVRHISAMCPNTSSTTNLVINGYNFPFSSVTAAGQQPTNFTFAAQNNVCPNTTITSADSSALSCLPSGSGSISVANGNYRINTGGYTTAPGTVSDGNTVTAQVASAATSNTPATATVTINGYDFPFTATTPTYSTTPFSFPDVTNVCPSAVTESAQTPALSVAGTAAVNAPSCGTTPQVNRYTTAWQTWANTQAITSGNSLKVRQTASASYGVSTTILLSYDSKYYPFTVTTKAAEAPTGVSFTTAYAAPSATNVASNTVTVNGLCAPVPISISGDSTSEFRKPSVSTTTYYNPSSTNVTIANGNTLELRLDAASTPGTTRTATVSIAGIPYDYSVTTYSGPNAFTLTPATAVTASTVEESSAVTISGLSHPPMTATYTSTSTTHNPGIIKSSNAGSTWSAYQSNGLTSTNVSVTNGDLIKVRLTSGAAGTTRTGTLTINGQTFSYTLAP